MYLQLQDHTVQCHVNRVWPFLTKIPPLYFTSYQSYSVIHMLHYIFSNFNYVHDTANNGMGLVNNYGMVLYNMAWVYYIGT